MPETRHEISHEIKISGSPEQVFTALTTAEGIQSWQTPHAVGTGEVGSKWEFKFSGRPEFAWEVVASQPSHVEWLCAAGPGDSVGTKATFEISALDEGTTLLVLTHSGWPGTHGNYRKCNTIWGVLLHHLAQAVKSGKPAPAFN
ncbi:SRPBCC family protein [Antrihabitans stalactiti]|uniref:SRPBCC domain-containing protein n=1 Tax=Antrihabitans stalactiti TaxID=2584121 RepID=A0A848KSV0_9NOCA|nr:SRPBCC domain-containing protein [Antrihabitans stalactiti]NMN99582.1 SRPBCC domain-containing protein [Antrihabitans stalactiti]